MCVDDRRLPYYVYNNNNIVFVSHTSLKDVIQTRIRSYTLKHRSQRFLAIFYGMKSKSSLYIDDLRRLSVPRDTCHRKDRVLFRRTTRETIILLCVDAYIIIGITMINVNKRRDMPVDRNTDRLVEQYT